MGGSYVYIELGANAPCVRNSSARVRVAPMKGGLSVRAEHVPHMTGQMFSNDFFGFWLILIFGATEKSLH